MTNQEALDIVKKALESVYIARAELDKLDYQFAMLPEFTKSLCLVVNAVATLDWLRLSLKQEIYRKEIEEKERAQFMLKEESPKNSLDNSLF